MSLYTAKEPSCIGRFVKCKPSTSDWTDEPQEARRVHELVLLAVKNAGLPQGTVYRFRNGVTEQAWFSSSSNFPHPPINPHSSSITNSRANRLQKLSNHTEKQDLLTKHYILGTNSLAPVELLLGLLRITNPTFEVNSCLPLYKVCSLDHALIECLSDMAINISDFTKMLIVLYAHLCLPLAKKCQEKCDLCA